MKFSALIPLSLILAATAGAMPQDDVDTDGPLTSIPIKGGPDKYTPYVPPTEDNEEEGVADVDVSTDDEVIAKRDEEPAVVVGSPLTGQEVEAEELSKRDDEEVEAEEDDDDDVDDDDDDDEDDDEAEPEDADEEDE